MNVLIWYEIVASWIIIGITGLILGIISTGYLIYKKSLIKLFIKW